MAASPRHKRASFSHALKVMQSAERSWPRIFSIVCAVFVFSSMVNSGAVTPEREKVFCVSPSEAFTSTALVNEFDIEK